MTWSMTGGVACAHSTSKIFADLREGFKTGKTKSIAYRKEQLAQMAWMMRDHKDRWYAALKADLGRHTMEADLYVPSGNNTTYFRLLTFFL